MIKLLSKFIHFTLMVNCLVGMGMLFAHSPWWFSASFWGVGAIVTHFLLVATIQPRPKNWHDASMYTRDSGVIMFVGLWWVFASILYVPALIMRGINSTLGIHH